MLSNRIAVFISRIIIAATDDVRICPRYVLIISLRNRRRRRRRRPIRLLRLRHTSRYRVSSNRWRRPNDVNTLRTSVRLPRRVITAERGGRHFAVVAVVRLLPTRISIARPTSSGKVPRFAAFFQKT